MATANIRTDVSAFSLHKLSSSFALVDSRPHAYSTSLFAPSRQQPQHQASVKVSAGDAVHYVLHLMEEPKTLVDSCLFFGSLDFAHTHLHNCQLKVDGRNFIGNVVQIVRLRGLSWAD